MWQTFVRSGRLGLGRLVLHADARENPVDKNGIMTAFSTVLTLFSVWNVDQTHEVL